MNRKILGAALWVVAIVAVVAALTIGLRYTSNVKDKKEHSLDMQQFAMCSAVPTDAVAIILPDCLETAARLYSDSNNAAWAPLASASHPNFRAFAEAVSALVADGSIETLKASKAVVSFHYTGDLHAMIAIDAGAASSKPSAEARKILEIADSLKIYGKWFNGAEADAEEAFMKDRSVIVAATSEAICKSSLRHMSEDTSVFDADGFTDAAEEISGKNLLFINNGYFGKIFTTVSSKKFLKYADFFKTTGLWTTLSLNTFTYDRFIATGKVSCEGGAQDYMAVFEESRPSVSMVSDMLPSTTQFAASIPSKDMAFYAKAYQSYADYRMGLSKFLSRQKSLQKGAGISPTSWLSGLDIREAAVAMFDVEGETEQFLLFKVGNEDLKILFKDTDIKTLEGYTPQVHKYIYAGFASSLLGGMFNIPTESRFTYMNGWLIVGSENGVKAYVDGKVLKHTLTDSPLLTSHNDILGTTSHAFWMYVPVSDNEELLYKTFKKNYAGFLQASVVDGKESQIFVISKEKNKVSLNISMARAIIVPEEVDGAPDEVVIPKGPFSVKNSGTGKTDKLYSRSGRLTLVEEGEELWNIDFPGALCGRVCNVDLFANGRIQFAFCSGRNVYVLDRLGNVVKDFPVELEKPVLLGPDVYDFNNARKYNFLVLNTDNTIDMYNFKGEKPASWLGIKPVEKVLSMPERLEISGKTHWVVRTISHTIVYPFYGGEPEKTYDGRVELSNINPDTTQTE